MKFSTSLIALCAAFSAVQAAPAAQTFTIQGCTGREFTGTCQTFTCGWFQCCNFKTGLFTNDLISVRARGGLNAVLFSGKDCNGNYLEIDQSGYGNIGAAQYLSVSGPTNKNGP